jgi:uncharacterized protein YacL
MIALFVFVLALVGFASIAASMRRHQNLVPRLTRYRTLFRNGGFVLLLASLAISIAQPNSSAAFVEWFFLLTAAGIPVVAAMTIQTQAASHRRQNKNTR